MSLRQIAPIVGAIAGFIIGGPAGAQYGFMLGSAAGNAWDPPTFKGPGIGELAAQTAQEGGPRGIIFGLSPPMAGNVIATAAPITVKEKKKTGGKGSSKVEVESVYRTYAIGVCEGPIRRFVRVWRNGILVWSNQTDDEVNFDPYHNAPIVHGQRIPQNRDTFAKLADFHLGTFDQAPDPGLESQFGVGKTPAFRGTAYMVMRRDDVTDFRGGIPQYLFQVERCEGDYFTSRVYPIEDVEEMHMTATLRKDSPNLQNDDEMQMAASFVSGDLRDILHFYDNWPPDEMHMTGDFRSGTLRNILRSYDNWPPDEMHMTGALRSGTLLVKLITYSNWPAEEMHMTAGLRSGTLS